MSLGLVSQAEKSRKVGLMSQAKKSHIAQTVKGARETRGRGVMKILLCAPWDETVLGRITRYAYQALVDEGHRVEVFDFRQRKYSRWPLVQPLKKALRKVWPKAPSPYDVVAVRDAVDRDVNQRLLERCRALSPELLLVFCGENITPATLTAVREMGATTANWFHDSLIYTWRRDLVRHVLPVYDLLFLVDDLDVLKQVGVSFTRARTLPLACSPDVHRPMALSKDERRRWGAQVAFVGTVTADRARVLKELTGFHLGIWGAWQGRDPSLEAFYREKNVRGEDAAKIYNASRVNLDIHVLFGVREERYNVTPRVFEVPACRGFLLTCAVPQLERLYAPGEEIAVYRDVEELKERIRYYLDHEEERVAQAGRAHARVLREHTYAQRIRSLVQAVEDFKRGVTSTGQTR